MSREEKQQLQQAELQKQLWSIANTLRGNMDANDFKNYILGLIFYRYLSENLVNYVNTTYCKKFFLKNFYQVRNQYWVYITFQYAAYQRYKQDP